MVSLVVDASVSAQWYVLESETDAAVRLLQSDAELLAPELIVAEVTSTLWKLERRKRIPPGTATIALEAFLKVDIGLIPMIDLAEEALGLAMRLGTAAYDCFYLALAIREGCAFVTADRKFYNATRLHLSEHVVWVEDIPLP